MNLYIKQHIGLSFQNSGEITEYYRSLQVDYPKFFKMDNLSKLGFLAAEKIWDSALRRNDGQHGRDDIAIICFNRSASLEIDAQFQATIHDNKNYFPSPSLFVYTLPNICAGEIAIRHKIHGETSFYVAQKFDAEQFVETVENAFFDSSTNEVLFAWIESLDKKSEIFMCLVDKNSVTNTSFIKENILNLKNQYKWNS
jgi:hypothetical protein